MKRNRLAALGTVLVFSMLAAAPMGAAQAQGGGAAAGSTPQAASPDSQRFEQTKARLLKFMDARLQALQKAQSCVQGATNRDQLRSCRRQEHESMRPMHGQHGGPGRDGPGKGPGPR